MGRFSKKSNVPEAEILKRTKIGDLWYSVLEANNNGKPALQIFADRDDQYALFMFQQFPKAAALVEAAGVIEHFAEHGTLPKKKAKKVADDE